MELFQAQVFVLLHRLHDYMVGLRNLACCSQVGCRNGYEVKNLTNEAWEKGYFGQWVLGIFLFLRERIKEWMISLLPCVILSGFDGWKFCTHPERSKCLWWQRSERKTTDIVDHIAVPINQPSQTPIMNQDFLLQW